MDQKNIKKIVLAYSGGLDTSIIIPCDEAYMRTKVMVRQAIYPTVSIFGYGSSTRSDIAGKPDLAVHR